MSQLKYSPCDLEKRFDRNLINLNKSKESLTKIDYTKVSANVVVRQLRLLKKSELCHSEA